MAAEELVGAYVVPFVTAGLVLENRGLIPSWIYLSLAKQWKCH